MRAFKGICILLCRAMATMSACCHVDRQMTRDKESHPVVSQLYITKSHYIMACFNEYIST